MTRTPPKTTIFPYTTLFRSYQMAKGDQSVPNPNGTAILRAGDLADRATFYRHDLAFARSEEHTSELQSHSDLVCRLLLEKKKKNIENARRAVRTLHLRKIET